MLCVIPYSSEAGVELYRPVDLCGVRNATADMLPCPPPPAGARPLRGLPFEIVDYVVLGGGDEIAVAASGPAPYVIVAHRLLESVRPEFDSVGSPVAEYEMMLADGAVHRVAIREGFEVQRLPLQWGIGAYASVLDSEDSLLGRDECCRNGARQMETYDIETVAAGDHIARGDWYLWVWDNPSPETPVDRMIMRGLASRILIGGITLGHASEYPLVRQAARPVRVVLEESDG